MARRFPEDGRGEMRGAGGPLLCVGDLLQDLSEDAGLSSAAALASPPVEHDTSRLPSSDLLRLFEEAYEDLAKSLDGTDQSWIQSTLKLCSAVEAANKLNNLAQINAEMLLEKLESLEIMVGLCNSVVESARALRGGE